MTRTKSSDAALRLPPESPILELARALEAVGGRALVVGGWVRDRLRGLTPVGDEIDVEVFGLAETQLESALARLGEVRRVGKSFPIFLVKGWPVEVSLPRGEGGVGLGGGGVATRFAEAARWRDLTVNAMAWDPLRGELLDPLRGRDDLEAGRLRAADASLFATDPLRGLRTAQLAARLEMQSDPALLALCGAQDLSALPAERLFEEFRKLWLRSRRPAIALSFLHDSGLLRFFPELEALVGVPQDARWHPEGDVWIHTCMVVDEAAALRSGVPDEDLALLFGALCHDLGKAAVTLHRGDHIVSPGHSEAGRAPTERFLARLRAPNALVRRVVALVLHHLAPAMYARGGEGEAGPRAYRRLARRLRAADVSTDLLLRVATADHFGRTTEDARARSFPAGERFRERAAQVAQEAGSRGDVVRGRDVLARGVEPGPEVGRILDRCRSIQDETGSTDPDQILDHVLESDS